MASARESSGVRLASESFSNEMMLLESTGLYHRHGDCQSWSRAHKSLNQKEKKKRHRLEFFYNLEIAFCLSYLGVGIPARDFHKRPRREV